MFRLFRRYPFFKFLAIAQVLLLARRHFTQLDAGERRRMVALLRNARHMTAAEKDELNALVTKLEPRAFAGSAVHHLSPIGLPRRFTGARR